MEPQNSEEFLEEQREAWIKICLEHRQKEYSEPVHFISDALPEKVRKYDARLTFINHKFISNSISSYYMEFLLKSTVMYLWLNMYLCFTDSHQEKKGSFGFWTCISELCERQ